MLLVDVLSAPQVHTVTRPAKDTLTQTGARTHGSMAVLQYARMPGGKLTLTSRETFAQTLKGKEHLML